MLLQVLLKVVNQLIFMGPLDTSISSKIQSQGQGYSSVCNKQWYIAVYMTFSCFPVPWSVKQINNIGSLFVDKSCCFCFPLLYFVSLFLQYYECDFIFPKIYNFTTSNNHQIYSMFGQLCKNITADKYFPFNRRSQAILKQRL